MKSAMIVCAFLVLACLCLQAKAITCKVDGEELSVGDHHRNCMKVTCHEDGTMSGLGCAEYHCQPGKQTGYHQTDLTKPYPECCAHPICAS